MNLNIILKNIKPSEKEEVEMKKFIDKLLDTASKISKNVKPIICGSIEKGTWLSNKNEIDLFLLFSPSISKKVLEKKGLDFAKKIIKALKGRYQIAFAEHPYLRGWTGKYQIDIVPCYSISDPEKIKSAVDRTPHHVKFVKSNLKNPDEVRLLKQFCIANKCYGADVKTQGFSGYLCELLIIKHDGFLNLSKEAAKWRAGYVISFDKIDRESTFKKFKGPLIVIDPVDRNRNVGAPVSIENFYRFVRACKDFIDKPGKEFFFKQEVKPYSLLEIKKEFNRRGTRWYLISFDKPDVLEDILYPQLRRCTKAIEKLLNQYGFRVLRSDFYCNKECVLVFEMETWQVPRIMKNIGPDVYSKHAEQFLKHYKENKVYTEGENWIVETEREFATVLHFLKDLLKKSEKELLEKGIPSKIAPQIKKCKICGGGDTLKHIEKLQDNFRVFLREWFEKDLNVI
jgi:tRNA nucleotidyltransferase (CCA-adding enzyme)